MATGNNVRFLSWVPAVVLALLITSCANVPGLRSQHDPFESFNRAMHSFNEGFDKAFGEPIAKLYNTVTPQPVHRGITNFFSNLGDVTVIVNKLLQGQFSAAARSTGRIVVNSTLGLLGFIDVASNMGIEKQRADFGQTLGKWGIKESSYVVLPFLGPSTVRDAFGLVADAFTDPVLYPEDDAIRFGTFGVRAVDKRANLLDESRVLREAALDSYIFTREAYLQQRSNLIQDGAPPPVEDEESAIYSPLP
ncbi:MAG: MlaA family lipoprotein [Burkholderiales bacterium]